MENPKFVESDAEPEGDMLKRQATMARKPGQARHRSPNYPFIGLEKAIERTRQIYDQDRRHEVPMKVACEQRWEYKPGGSQADQTIAALKAYGLIDVNGNGNSRTIRVSDRAYRILLNATDASERIKDAALSPAINGELWQKYGTDGLPTNDLIRHYLIFERHFNEDIVDSFIANFRETISFAKLDSSDKIRADVLSGLDNEPNPSDEGGGKMIQDAGQGQQRQNQPPPPPLVGQKDFPLYLSNNKRAILYVPATMTAKDYELLKRQIDNHMAIIEATSVADDKPS